MAVYKYDVVIIGSGPAGESAAEGCAKKNLRVAVIDGLSVRAQESGSDWYRKQLNQVGGNCTHLGTIPSKALRHSVKQIMQFNKNALFKEVTKSFRASYPAVQRAASKVIRRQVDKREELYDRHNVDLFYGWAKIEDKNKIIIEKESGTEDIVHTKYIIIATGSKPFHPEGVDFSNKYIRDSDTILDLKETPRTLIIYGAGVIGSEYASIFSGLGVKVDLINTRDRLLSFLDDDISEALSYHLREYGVLIRHNETFQSIDVTDKGVVLRLESGKKLRADYLLWCNGRSGNTQNMGLEKIGLQPDKRGQLEVNEHYRTELDNVFAIGDVVGWPSLASAAYDQGRCAASAITGAEDDIRTIKEVATGIYTIPEISSIGKTERELTKEKTPYEVGLAKFEDTARAQITGEDVGVLKILFHSETLQILGIHCFGYQASEIIHIGQAIMAQEDSANTLKYFVNTTFNYPTLAEAYRIAALDGLSRVF